MYLKDFFPDYIVENQEFECKRTISKDETQMVDWLKCIAGMSNNNGGDFFIGVEDQTYEEIIDMSIPFVKYKNTSEVKIQHWYF